MPKKIIPIVLSLCLIFGVTSYAENEDAVNESENPPIAREMPEQGEKPTDMRQAPQEGNTPERPQGENRGGQAPRGDFTPPRQNETSNTAEKPNMPQQSENNQNVTAPSENNAEKQKNTDAASGENDAQNALENAPGENGENAPFPGDMPDGFPDDARNTQNAESEQTAGFIGFVKTYSTPITSVFLLIAAYVFVILYKRRNY